MPTLASAPAPASAVEEASASAVSKAPAPASNSGSTSPQATVALRKNFVITPLFLAVVPVCSINKQPFFIYALLGAYL